MSPPGARPRDRRCRLNALAFDTGPPLVRDEPAAAYECDSDEHGRLGLSGATNRLNIVCVRGTVSQQLWPISVKGVIYSDLWVGDAEPYPEVTKSRLNRLESRRDSPSIPRALSAPSVVRIHPAATTTFEVS